MMRSSQASILYAAPLLGLTALSACGSESESDIADRAGKIALAPGGNALWSRSAPHRAATAGARAGDSERTLLPPTWPDRPQRLQPLGRNVQVNDPALDDIEVFFTDPPTRPFLNVTQSETSIAARGMDIVVAYNSSAGIEVVQADDTLETERWLFGGFSSSHDGGRTWVSGFFPPLPGSVSTFGDPVVRVDRRGIFNFVQLGADALGQTNIQFNRSLDAGRTWGETVPVAQDQGADKPWLAVGPDPADRRRDNLYVTWSSYQPPEAPERIELRLARSTDGGETWTSSVIFAPEPDPDPARPQQALQFSNPYVDPADGRLYVPFLHWSFADADFVRVLVSDDAGETFRFLEINPGAPDPTLLPAVQPGELIDCGDTGGTRLSITDGPPRTGRFGLPTYIHASRVITQPTFAARGGVLYLAWSASTSEMRGERDAGSNILLIRSLDGGETWTRPLVVAAASEEDIEHVLPALTIGRDSSEVHVVYYTQHRDGSIDVDMASSFDTGESFGAEDRRRVTDTSFRLSPTNIPLDVPFDEHYPTTNFDRLVAPCYNLGEYLDVTSARSNVYAAWGDLRNPITEPVHPADPISGETHSQADVFFQAFRAR
ncbi:sialidase family protein [Sorangium sp. So ce131]|uniref:sialidase family protein n=1 Tax=Sorangium sp. So ce131 TaxID=3133282 RepID=UPI003F5F86AE